MKGVVEIEFIIAVFVFITTISFVTFLIVDSIPAYHTTASGESLKSKAYQFSEMLFMDEGYPRNWNTLPFAQTNRIGFSSGERYRFDETKIAYLYSVCQPAPGGAGYLAVKNRLGLESAYDIIIEAYYIDNTPVADSAIVCGPDVLSQLRQQFQFTRIGAAANNRIILMKVTVLG